MDQRFNIRAKIITLLENLWTELHDLVFSMSAQMWHEEHEGKKRKWHINKTSSKLKTFAYWRTLSGKWNNTYWMGENIIFRYKMYIIYIYIRDLESRIYE